MAGSRLSLWIVVALAAAAGLLAPGGRIIADVDLAMLLRFMAVLKAAMTVGAVGLVEWRLRSYATRAFAGGMIGAVGLMAAASGLIWSLGHVALGAALFHIGFLAFLGLSWRDGVALRLPPHLPRFLSPRFASGVLPYGLTTGTATSFLRRNGRVQGGS